jgi:hypothetical protein
MSSLPVIALFSSAVAILGATSANKVAGYAAAALGVAALVWAAAMH